jgi:hypothetical protein
LPRQDISLLLQDLGFRTALPEGAYYLFCGLQECPGLGEQVIDGSGHVFVDLVDHGVSGLCSRAIFFMTIATDLTVETLLPMETTTKSTATSSSSSSSSSGSADTTFFQPNVAASRVLSTADNRRIRRRQDPSKTGSVEDSIRMMDPG